MYSRTLALFLVVFLACGFCSAAAITPHQEIDVSLDGRGCGRWACKFVEPDASTDSTSESTSAFYIPGWEPAYVTDSNIPKPTATTQTSSPAVESETAAPPETTASAAQAKVTIAGSGPALQAHVANGAGALRPRGSTSNHMVMALGAVALTICLL